MHRTEMLWFEDVSAINEPVLSFPVLGRISMRQFFILGITGMISYALFSSTHGLVSAIPIAIGAFLTLIRPKVGTTEWMALSIISFLFGRRAGQKRPFEIKMPRSRKLAKAGKKPSIPDHTEPKNKTMPPLDLPKPFCFKMRLEDSSGMPVASKRKTEYLDSDKIGVLTTDANGDLEVVMIPQTLGQKTITVHVRIQNEPVFSEVIEFTVPQENLP